MRHSPNQPPPQEGFPIRKWSIELYLVNEADGSLVPANVYEKATYHLHPSFGDREKQTFKAPPFRCAEEGWGEFEAKIVLTPMGKAKDHTVHHDLNFAENEYDANHKVVSCPSAVGQCMYLGACICGSMHVHGADDADRRSQIPSPT